LRFRSILVALALSISLAACGSGSATHGTGKGTVAAVDAARGEITLDHGDIPGIMKAMTMTFAVSDKKVLDGVAPGAKVEFDVDATGAEPRVTAIRPR
jgi:Cu/Ag efflux protein CusF